jgi:hypothetical protein
LLQIDSNTIVAFDIPWLTSPPVMWREDAFEILVYSKECTFPNLLKQLLQFSK